VIKIFKDVQRDIYEKIKDIKPVPELSNRGSSKFKVSSAEKVLKPIVKKNDILIVSGAYFGDEGKGKMTDAIAGNPLIKVIARMNSGENAGHTVWKNGIKYTFHVVPSAIVAPDKVCLIGPECVVDPVNFMEKEIGNLIEAKVNYKNRFFIGNVHLVCPHHKIMDFALSPTNSSTLMGMSYIHSSKSRKRGLRLNDLFNSRAAQIKKLEDDLEIYYAMLKQTGQKEKQILKGLKELAKKRRVPDHLFGFLKAEDKISYVLNLFKKTVVDNPHFPQRKDVNDFINRSLEKGQKILLESPQSYWLSNATEKHWKSSTSAQTHAVGVLASTKINVAKYKISVINVGKTPADSRVGIGANPSSFVPQKYFSMQGITTLDDIGDSCSNFDKIQKQYYESVQKNGILEPTDYEGKSISEAMAIGASREFGEKGSTTGKPRVTGLFDCLAAKQVNEAQGPYFFISALDRGDSQDYAGMTVAYVFHNPNEEMIVDSNGMQYNNGDIIRIGDPYPCENVLKYCFPIIKVMPGWKNTPIGVGKRKSNDPLPKSVQEFLNVIEGLTEFKVIGIGNGPDTKNVIYLSH